jgi:hypothetical protein
MAWKAGSGKVAIGVREMKSQDVSRDVTEAVLPKGFGVVVSRMRFKLV